MMLLSLTNMCDTNVMKRQCNAYDMMKARVHGERRNLVPVRRELKSRRRELR